MKQIEINSVVKKTVSFLGPRPKFLYGYNEKPYGVLVEYIKEQVESLYNLGYTRFITDGSQGFGQCVFWAIESLKRNGLPIENIVYVPHLGQERAWHKVGTFSKAEYYLMLNVADEVKVFANYEPKKNISHIVYKNNEAMINDSNLFVVLYSDDSWKQYRQGMINSAVKHAKLRGVPTSVINYVNDKPFANLKTKSI